jgi:uncharacterized protein (DUF433 family)
MVVACKKCGVRICVNSSGVNKAVVHAKYPLLTVEELTETIAGCIVYSRADLAWGYTQLEFAEDYRYLTAFVIYDGIFQCRS